MMYKFKCIKCGNTEEKENERLRTRCEQARDESTGYMQQLEKENAELKAQLQKKVNTTTVSDYPYSALKLEQAKEIIREYVRIQNACFTNEDDVYVAERDLLTNAEAFLKE